MDSPHHPHRCCRSRNDRHREPRPGPSRSARTHTGPVRNRARRERHNRAECGALRRQELLSEAGQARLRRGCPTWLVNGLGWQTPEFPSRSAVEG